MQAIFYVAAFLVSFTVSNAIEDGNTWKKVTGKDAQITEQAQRPADEPSGDSSQSAVWVFPSLGNL